MTCQSPQACSVSAGSKQNKVEWMWRVGLNMRLAVMVILALLALMKPALAAAAVWTVGKGDGLVVRFDRPVTSIMVADEAVADVEVLSPTSAYLFGRNTGSTRVTALDAQEKVVVNARVRVGVGLEGKVEETARGRRVVAKGTASSLEEGVEQHALLSGHAAEGVQGVNLTTQESLQQINLRVRFAEVSRQELLRYGVNWQALINSGSFAFGLITGGPVSSGAGAGNTLSGSFSSNSANVDMILDALQSNGALEILAEPNITTVTGRSASFLAGGEIPVPVPVTNEMVGIEYKPYGVSLVFTPTLLPNDRISLQVRPEVSTLAGSGIVEIAGTSIPAFRVRRADTQVEVGSGQTFAIAGLFQRDSSTDADQLPLLGDIPILGNLFRSKRFQRNETELVILITPYLVRPVSGQSAATPLDHASENPANLMLGDRANRRNAADFGFFVF